MSAATCDTMGLSSFQKELWLAYKALPDGHPGIFSGGRFLLEGTVDPDIAREALRRIVAHFSLYSSVLELDPEGMPFFRRNIFREPYFTFTDVSADADPEQAALTVCDNFVEYPLQPLDAPLVLFALVRVSATRSYFLLKTFHLLSSGMGNAACFSLFSLCYSDVLAGRETDMGQSPDWQAIVDKDMAHCDSARAGLDRSFWVEKIKAMSNERTFPPRHGHADVLGDSAFSVYPMSRNGMELLEYAVASTKISSAVLLTALHAVALRRLADAPIPVTFMVDHGERKDIFQMQGFMVNAVPVLPDGMEDMTFWEAVQAFSLHMQRLRRHTRTSVPKVLREAGVLQGMSRLWDINLNYLADAQPVGNSFFVQRDFIPLCSKKEEILFGLYVLHGIAPGDPLRFAAHYSRRHFTEDDIRRYVARLESILSIARAHPDQLLRDYSVLLDDEQTKLARWESGGERPIPAYTLPQLFDRAARNSPDRLAVLGEDGSHRSYAQVCRNAGRLARTLLDAGIQKGDVVAVLARRHPALPESILGIMACGAVYLPVDPDYPEKRITHMLDDSGARLVLVLAEKDSGSAAACKTLRWATPRSDASDDFKAWMMRGAITQPPEA